MMRGSWRVVPATFCLIFIEKRLAFFSRVFGRMLGFILTWMLRLKGHSNVDFRIGSISLSFIAGKIMFRDLLLVCDDFSIRCNDGWLVFSYWRNCPGTLNLAKKLVLNKMPFLRIKYTDLHCSAQPPSPHSLGIYFCNFGIL